MAIADTTARNSRASDFSADYSTATLEFKEGSTVLATHTLTGFGAPSTGLITANAVADATIAEDGTADSALWSDTAGSYILTVGTTGSGADVIINTLSFVAGETSSISSATVDFPA